MISPALARRLKSCGATYTDEGPRPKRGADIFGTGPYPRTWGEFVGQDSAKMRLQLAVRASRERGTRLPHILLATGAPGVGKSSLARLVAAEAGVGFVELSGVVKVEEARTAMRAMRDGDILFLDEIHQMVAGGKAKAEWLLHLLQDGRLLTSAGAEQMPGITVVAATTDAGLLPQTILGRFPVRPVFVTYTDEEAVQIIGTLADRMGFGSAMPPVPVADLAAIARAGNNAPRDMMSLLGTYGDTQFAGDGGYDLGLTLELSGVTWDGLDRLAQDYLIVLSGLRGVASQATIAGQLVEPGPLRHVEARLMEGDYISIEANGRRLTDAGRRRAEELKRERGLAPDAPEAAA